jgi:hypothetical protein
MSEDHLFPHAVLPPPSRTVYSSLLDDVPGPRHARVQQTLNHKICFLHVPVGTHNEHDRQNVAPLQGPPESLRPRGGLRTSLNQLHVFGDVQMRKLGQLHPFTHRSYIYLHCSHSPPLLLDAHATWLIVAPLPTMPVATLKSSLARTVPQITCDDLFLTRNPWYCARHTQEFEIKHYMHFSILELSAQCYLPCQTFLNSQTKNFYICYSLILYLYRLEWTSWK